MKIQIKLPPIPPFPKTILQRQILIMLLLQRQLTVPAGSIITCSKIQREATITLTGSGLKLDLTYHPGQLPNLVHWKRFEQGSYVLGLEPANCRVDGRAEERARGTLSYLKPGEKRCYELEFAVSAI